MGNWNMKIKIWDWGLSFELGDKGKGIGNRDWDQGFGLGKETWKFDA